MPGVPAAYQGWVSQAAAATRMPASVVAAQINMESGFNPRATSPTGAQGIAQFEPGTWSGLGIKGSPYEPGAALQGYSKFMGGLVQQYGGNLRNALAAYNAGSGNLRAGFGYADAILKQAGAPTSLSSSPDANSSSPSSPSTSQTATINVPTFDQAGYNQANARYIAGRFLQSQNSTANPYRSGGSNPPSVLLGPGLLTSKPPNIANYQGTKQEQVQLQNATAGLQRLVGTPLVNTHAGAQGDMNPIPGAVMGRTDMGVDANLKPGAPIVAPNDAKVVAVVPNWYKGQPYVAVQILKGPNAGKVMYVAEQINGVPKAGTIIKKGQPITRYAQSGTGIEIGWASPSNPTQTLAQATSGYSEGQQTGAGSNFRSYLGALGG